MKHFVERQSFLHKKAMLILEEYSQQKALVKVCSEGIAAIESGTCDYINTKETFQAAGDEATGKMLNLHIEYYEVMREINEPIVFKELQMDNARPVGNLVEVAEEYFAQN